ncbi:MAG TPA: hypothetical protein VFY60_01530 [Pyrinomonadaceae bacterium]|nr:hypothetical protein [Pyrinomonadaceae bacterium]
MTTQPQSSKCRVSLPSTLITLAVIILFSCSHTVLAQQRDGEEPASATSGGSSSTSGRVNFDIIQLLNGEYLEMFGAGGSRGTLRGNPTTPAIELGTSTAHPIIFSTSSAERMRIDANGFVGIGTTNPATPLDLYAPAAIAYAPNSAQAARIRLFNSTSTLNNVFEIDLGSFDSNNVPSSRVRLAGIATDQTPGLTSGDFAIGLRRQGVWFEAARFTSAGNVGIGTATPAYKLDVAGAIRSSSGGFIFPDGTVQTTAGGGGGGGSQWVTSGTNIFYNGGNVGLGTSAPAVGLDIAQNKAIRVGQAYLSSGGNYVHLANNAWYNGASWQFPGGVGALYQINGQSHVFYSHNGAGSFTPQLYLPGNGFVGIGTTNPTARLHVDGGTIRLSSGVGEVPFQLYSYSNSDSLWLASGNPSKSEIHLTPGYAIDYDRSLSIQYTPGVTGAAGGVLNIGQISRNAPTFTHGATALFTNGLERLRINPAGNVGIGTPAPAHRLDVQGGAINASGGLCIAGDCKTAWSQVGGGTSSQWTTTGANIHYTTGNVGIGTSVAPVAKLHVQGDARVTSNLVVDGNIAARYQDLAEWVPAAEQLAAGTVVVLDATKSNQVTSSNTSYDTRVAGVISAQPGIVLGEKGDNKVLVATTGRVRVKVDATSAPIEIGDLLVTSDREGFAMKSMPVEIGSARIHRPGTLIGKALERLAGGTGEILVLLSLQ